MPLTRLSNETKAKIVLIKKEFLRVNPKFEEMVLSENFLINRAFDYYLKNSPYKNDYEE